MCESVCLCRSGPWFSINIVHIYIEREREKERETEPKLPPESPTFSFKPRQRPAWKMVLIADWVPCAVGQRQELSVIVRWTKAFLGRTLDLDPLVQGYPVKAGTGDAQPIFQVQI